MKDELTLLDTNILAYAFDETEPLKRKKCKRLIAPIFKGEAKGAVSNQVLAELFYVLTKRVRRPLEEGKAAKIVLGFLYSSNWVKINYSVQTVGKAAATAIKQKMHFWDALIAETMLENGVFRIITENNKDFSRIKQLEVANPL